MSDTQEVAKAGEEAKIAVSKLADRAISLGRELETCNQSWLELLHEDEARHQEEIQKLQDVIHQFLDVICRPVGSLDYEIPKSREASRAIVALHETVKRNP
jgi:hypothetical protein